jgi:hypothetical protein
MLKNSPTLIALCISYVVSLALLNNFMQVISKELSAIIRQLVSTCRVVVVWAVGLIIYNYDTSLGESWDKWSFMQLGAFVVLVRGFPTMVSLISRRSRVYEMCCKHGAQLTFSISRASTSGAVVLHPRAR